MAQLIMGYFRFECLRCGKIWRMKLNIQHDNNDYRRDCPSCTYETIGEMIEVAQ